MSTAKQKANARRDLESGKRVILHSTKLTIKQRARVEALALETAQLILQMLREHPYTHGYEVSHYPTGDLTHTFYVRGHGLSHTVYMNCRKQTFTIYEDTSARATVAVARDMDQLYAALHEIL